MYTPRFSPGVIGIRTLGPKAGSEGQKGIYVSDLLRDPLPCTAEETDLEEMMEIREGKW